MVLFWNIHVVFLSLFLLLTIPFSIISAENSETTYIVSLQNDLKPSVFSDVEHWYTATLNSLTVTTDNYPSKTHTPFLHVYTTVFHGFSAKLTKAQARLLKNRPGVLAVFPDRLRQLHTTRSPEFLGLASFDPEYVPSNLLSESDSGSDVIVGVFDTGIWPERRSFHDEGLGPVPSRWKGECVEGKNFTKLNCNRKVIGARYFIAGYEAGTGRFNSSVDIKSPIDSDGHGTHTASTVAGRAVSDANLFGFAKGVAVGIAPKARLAAYKICWKKGCMDSDILAAFDKAVEDGVDVISISVGGGAFIYNMDSIAIGSFGAMEKGILISASAGNDGPGRMTVTNSAPWITTVGASTIDRKFPADLVLGDGQVIVGASVYDGGQKNTSLPLIYGGNASVSHGGKRGSSFLSARCMPESLDKDLVGGKIVVCDRGGTGRVAKGEVVKSAGGAGVVIANVAPLGEGLIADAHVIPGLSVTESDGNRVRGYINSHPNPTAALIFRGTENGAKPAPVVASFSSRGPSGESLYVLKPDVIAPGVNILAAWPGDVAPTELSSDTRRSEFNIVSGTSMSCPHVSGLAALLKGAHPEWSPAMIRSALMTTAYVADLEGKPIMDEKSYNVSTVWDMGAGHVNPEKAVDPGLVYDITPNDYLNFLCSSNYTAQDLRQIARKAVKCPGPGEHRKPPWDLNYPAISVVIDASSLTSTVVRATRTVTYVGEGASTYNVAVTNPNGAMAKVTPTKLDFTAKDEKQEYVVEITAEKLAVTPGKSVTELGKVVWSDGKRQVVSPLLVVWKKAY
nr:subtilisin-like protease SBT1.5 [Ipomoea batatas]GMD25021.1 subtilisin-like protease SBT1.5 [Ipomoea batatas]